MKRSLVCICIIPITLKVGKTFHVFPTLSVTQLKCLLEPAADDILKKNERNYWTKMRLPISYEWFENPNKKLTL